MLKVGTLVSWRGSVGLVMGPVLKGRAAGPSDVWVKWTDEPEPKWECGLRLEVLSASR